MKKIAFIITVLTFTSIYSFAQDKTMPDAPPQYENITEMMKKMQQEMMKMFGGKVDSTESSDDFGMSFPGMKMDTSMFKSFGMLFDGKEWKNMMPNDSTGNSMLRGFGDKMPDFGGGLDLSEMMKNFEKMFGEGLGGMQTMPRIEPENKQRRSEESDKKEKKYKTEKL